MTADDIVEPSQPMTRATMPRSKFGAHRIPHTPGEPVWVFGYGSLMWNPGFPYMIRQEAVLHGYHRRFCVYSYRYRGTPEAPGLVLGLDRGGSCRGVAFKIAPQDAPEALQYLWDREMVNGVYRPTRINLRLHKSRSDTLCPGSGGGMIADAATFVVDRGHEQYCPELPPETAAELIATRHGLNGPNADYLFNTVTHLTEAGITGTALHRLAARVEALLSRKG
jgi:glutathione-specific gamma-glutamylcyclotransferase